MSYPTTYSNWQSDPVGFWEKAAEEIHWYKKWDVALDQSQAPIYRWFQGGETNTCYNCLDRHVEGGRADQYALIYDSPITGQIKKYTYQELRDQVAKLAGVIAGMGVTKGERVIIYMPMVPEAAMAMLACARIGAIHSVVFGGFASNELATRIDDAKPKLIISASCGLEPTRVVEYKPLLDTAIDMAEHKVTQTLIFQREQHPCVLIDGRDVDWVDAMSNANPVDCVPVGATDPCYILYTSGTTGQPKGVVRDTGGHMVGLKWSMKNVYGVDPGDVYWAASDVGWVVGHSYIVYGPLLHGCTTIMFEGKPVGTPDAGTFWRVVQDHGVVCLFTAPTAFRAIKRVDPQGQLVGNYDMSTFRSLFLAGERCDPDTLHWAEDKLGVPVIDHWWQTETGWSICANPMGVELLPVKPGSAGVPMPGYDVQILGPNGEQVPPGQIGAVVVKLPLPPGSLPTLWQKDELYKAKYLEHHTGYYSTADAGFKDEDGYLHIMARTDDIINVAGHRLSTGGMEEVLASHPDVAECAVIGVKDDLKGEIPIGLLVLNAGVERDHSKIENEVVQMVRNQIGPVAAFKKAAVVDRLPKTRSGKILRGTIKKIADKTEWKMPATIDAPVILDEMGAAVGRLGYG